MNKVSIIVPNYNHEKFLVQRMESILSQTYQDFEIIILDDCSTDGSRLIIEKYRNNNKVSDVIYNVNNGGSAFLQWKRGISAAKGEYIWIAESDDYCDPNFLELAVDKLQNGFDLFYARTVNVDYEGAPKSNNLGWYEDLSKDKWANDFENNASDEVREMLFVKNTIPNASAVLFKNKDEIENLLKEISEMKFCGDWMFWMKYLLGSDKMYYSTFTNNYFRAHSATTRNSFNDKLRNREVLTVLQFVLDNTTSNNKNKKLVKYYFYNHLFKNQKWKLFDNCSAAISEICISTHFISCWLKYYLKN